MFSIEEFKLHLRDRLEYEKLQVCTCINSQIGPKFVLTTYKKLGHTN